MPTPYETPVNGRKQERNVNTGCTALYQFSIADSKDIMLFLAEKHPEQGLYPTNQKSGIDQYINDFYAKFNFIGVFTFGNLATMKLSILDFEELLGIFLN